MTERSENIRGAAMMTAATAFFALGDTCIKAIGTEISLPQLLFLRGIVASICIGLLAWRMRGLTLRLSRRDWTLLTVRCIAEAAAAYFFLTALVHMPIANVTALLQTLPFTVTLGAALLFKAPVGWRRASAIAVGFLGMLLILQPGGDGFSIWSIYALTSVACVTVRDLVTRALSPRVPSFTVAVLGVVSIMAFGGIASIGQEFAPMDTRVVLLIVACAVFSVAAFSFSVFAMRHGDISFTAPFRYSGLLAAAILGYFVFAEVPSWLEALGYVIVVAAGLFTLLREQAVNQKPGKPAA